MNQAPDRQVETLVARLLEPRLASLPPQEVLKVTREVFAQIVAELGDDQERIHKASEAVVMCVARRWGNIVQAGKASVLASRDSAEAVGLTPALAAELATQGAARGVRRVGPVAFSQLRNELCNLVENFDELTALKGTAPSGPRDLPIIVPEEQDWDFPSAEESWEEELQKVTSTEKIAAPVDLSAWDFDPSEDKSPLMKLPPAPAPRQKPKSLLWLWLTLMAILLAAAGALLYPH